MAYRIVNMASDPRSGQFAYFRSMADPWAGITVPVDITEFHAALKGRPFFLSFLYALTRAANAVPELRRRLLDGQVVEFDRCCPSYTASMFTVWWTVGSFPMRSSWRTASSGRRRP